MIITSINKFCQKHGKIAGLFILVVIAVPFVFMSYMTPSSNRTDNRLPDPMGSVFGDDISLEELGKAGYRHNPQADEDAKNRAVNTAIEKIIKLRKAEELNLTEVDNKLVTAEMVKHPYFSQQVSTDGKFDFAKYDKLPPAAKNYIEDMMVETIILDRLEKAIKADAKIDQAEIRKAFDKENVTYEIAAASVKNNDFRKTVKVTDEEIKAYFEKNSADFEEPAKIITDVVTFAGKDYRGEIDQSDEALKKYFEKNPEQFHVGEVKASQILVQLKPDADEAAKTAAKTKADEILAEVKKDVKKFGDIAKEKSDHYTKSQKGDLGWVGPQTQAWRLDKTCVDAALKLKVGEVSEVIETKAGFHILTVTELPKEFEAAKTEVSNLYLDAQMKKLGKQKAYEFASAVYEAEQTNSGKSTAELFNEIATAKKFKVLKTEPFVKGSNKPVKGIASRRFAANVDSLSKVKPLSMPIEGNGNTFYVAALAGEVASQIPEFKDAAEAKVKIKNILTTEKIKAAAKVKAEATLKTVKALIDGGSKFDTIAKTYKFKDIKAFKSNTMPSGLNAAIAVKEALTTAKTETLIGPFSGDNGVDVVYVKAIKPATDADFEKVKAEFTTRYENDIKTKFWNDYLENLKKEANIQLVAPFAPTPEITKK